MLRSLLRDDGTERTLGYTPGLCQRAPPCRALYGEDCGLSIESAPGENDCDRACAVWIKR